MVSAMPMSSLTPPVTFPVSSDTSTPAREALGVRNPAEIQDTPSSLPPQNLNADEVKGGSQRKSGGNRVDPLRRLPMQENSVGMGEGSGLAHNACELQEGLRYADVIVDPTCRRAGV